VMGEMEEWPAQSDVLSDEDGNARGMQDATYFKDSEFFSQCNVVQGKKRRPPRKWGDLKRPPRACGTILNIAQ
jgi:hypothetical protein